MEYNRGTRACREVKGISQSPAYPEWTPAWIPSSLWMEYIHGTRLCREVKGISQSPAYPEWTPAWIPSRMVRLPVSRWNSVVCENRRSEMWRAGVRPVQLAVLLRDFLGTWLCGSPNRSLLCRAEVSDTPAFSTGGLTNGKLRISWWFSVSPAAILTECCICLALEAACPSEACSCSRLQWPT